MCDRERPTCGRCAQLGLAALCMYQTPDPRGTMSHPPPPPAQAVDSETSTPEALAHEPMDTSPAVSTSYTSSSAPVSPATYPSSAPMTPPSYPSRAPSPPVYPACMLQKQQSPMPLPPVPPCERPPNDDFDMSMGSGSACAQASYPPPPVLNFPPVPMSACDQAYLMASTFPCLPWWNASSAFAGAPVLPAMPPCPPVTSPAQLPVDQPQQIPVPTWDTPAPMSCGEQRACTEQFDINQFLANVMQFPTAWEVPSMPPVPTPASAPAPTQETAAPALNPEEYRQLFDSMFNAGAPCAMDWDSLAEPPVSDTSISPPTPCSFLTTPCSSLGLDGFDFDNLLGITDAAGLPDMGLDLTPWDLSLPDEGEQLQEDLFQPFVPQSYNWLSPGYA
ncbi:hypothetical protein BD626DRAFT_559058 [Schizophyllum amplum]|uniref:Uncharacterized protein n=1 Tax=Schizophyllum amplum TaxID=97359 RepID=A0A550C6C5_9AGAR|nr:hypothetical protein BD626DRAFT_559058 [Auriculariopsis ampla]